MYVVEGFLNGVHYTLQVEELGRTTRITGSRNITAYLESHLGADYRATPTGPFGRFDQTDPASVLGALLGWTQVTRVTGDPPDILGGQRNQPGVVY